MTPYTGEDCYRVTAKGTDAWIVRHYPTRHTGRPCCTVTVRLTPADQAQAIPDADPFGHAAALHRAYLAIEQKHGRRIVDNNSGGV